MKDKQEKKERKQHQSLLPGWVVWAATYDNARFERVLSRRHAPWSRRALIYIAPAILWLFASWLVFCAVHIVYGGVFDGAANQSLVSGWWMLVPSAVWIPGMFTTRFLAFRWIHTAWKRITGESDLERYLPITHATTDMARETLRRIAERVRNREIPEQDFHIARDIAHLHWLCDKELRIRDLIREAAMAEQRSGAGS